MGRDISRCRDQRINNLAPNFMKVQSVVLDLSYRMRTKKLYTSKIIQKMNVAYLELHTRASIRNMHFTHNFTWNHPASATITAKVEAVNHNCHSLHQSAQSLG